MQEAAIIARARQFQRYHQALSLGIEDDCALFKPEPDYLYAWAVDTLVENTHFLREMPAEHIGWKSLAVNLSDLAAMNATPQACLLSLAVPPELNPNWLEEFFQGFQRCCDAYQVDLAGGDTVRQANTLNISVSVLGKTRRPFTRRGAQAGDLIILSGQHHGAAAQGLKDFQAGQHHSPWIKHQLLPQPRFDAAAHLQKFSRAHVLDTSDGLLTSVRLLADINHLGCEIYSARIPAIPTDAHDYIATVLHGGEEYELLGAIAPEEAALLDPQYFTCIGTLLETQKYTLHHQQEAFAFEDLGEGFTHF